MKDLFGNKKPVQIEGGEFWFNGNIIQAQNHPKLKPWVVFADLKRTNDAGPEGFFTFKDAINYCLLNPVKRPDHLPKDYL